MKNKRQAILVLSMDCTTELACDFSHSGLEIAANKNKRVNKVGTPTAGLQKLSEIIAEVLALFEPSISVFTGLPEGWVSSEIGIAYKKKLLSSLKEEFAGSDPFVIKDPHLHLFFPLVVAALQEFEVEISVLLIIREPFQTVSSLSIGQAYLDEKLLTVFLQYFLQAEYDSRSYQRVCIGSDYIQEQCLEALQKLNEELNLNGSDALSDSKTILLDDELMRIKNTESVIVDDRLFNNFPEGIKESLIWLQNMSKEQIRTQADLKLMESTFDLASSELKPEENEYKFLMQQLTLQKREVADLKVTLESTESKYRYQNILIEELTKSHEDLYNSISWRMSKPIRAMEVLGKEIRILNKSVFKNINSKKELWAIGKSVCSIFSKEGFRGVRSRIKGVLQHYEKFGDERYNSWIRRFDTINDESRVLFKKEIDSFRYKPLISVVMPVYNTPGDLLVRAIQSVQNQLYPHWELCIADDLSTDPNVKKQLKKFEAEDERIKVVYRTENGHISEATNSAIELVTGEFVALLDHDDELSEHALFWVVDTINKHPEVEMIYSDEDKIDLSHRRYTPYFKCDWNIDLFHSQNLFSHLGVFKTELLRKVNGVRKGFEGAQDYDLVLRCIELEPQPIIYHIPKVLYHWRIIPGSTALSTEEKPYAVLAGERALNESLKRRGISATAKYMDSGYRVRYELPDPTPLVSLIIPTKNSFTLLERCISSILEKSDYTNYEVIIVDNGSDEEAVLAYYKTLDKDKRFSILYDKRPFNYSSLNNQAVKIAKGSIIGLLNNDTEVINAEWMSELVSHACRPEVGAVGAKLLYPDDRIQHGGVIIGIAGSAAHSHRNTHRSNHGYFGRAGVIQSYSAVTGACLFVRKELYEEVGGLNESDLGIAFNDVDFCLKLKTKGYTNIWTPFAQLYHYESQTRGEDTQADNFARLKKERAYMRDMWKVYLDYDPAYSPNLSIDDENFSIAEIPRIQHVF